MLKKIKHLDDVFIPLINSKLPTVVGTDFYVYKQDKLHALLSRERFYNVEPVFGMVCDKARLKPACSVTETS